MPKFLRRLFGKPPQYSIYVDLSTKGKYSARLIEAADSGLFKGSPRTQVMLPASVRFKSFDEAAATMIERLDALCVDGSGECRCYREAKGDGGGTVVYEFANPSRSA